MAGSRFCSGAESRYAPVEGEGQAIVWALNNTRHYTLGNPKLVIATDHKPLVKVFGDRDLGDIVNPRLARLKEATLRWEFKVVHVPGVKNAGPDALSRLGGGPEAVAGVLRKAGPEQQEEEDQLWQEAVLVAEARGVTTGVV